MDRRQIGTILPRLGSLDKINSARQDQLWVQRLARPYVFADARVAMNGGW